jgi:hypothetical protein
MEQKFNPQKADSHLVAYSVHAEAPIILKPADLPQNLASIGAAEVVPDTASESESPELIARGWWLRSDPSTFMQCVTYLRGLVSNQEVPFDVSVGPF